MSSRHRRESATTLRTGAYQYALGGGEGVVSRAAHAGVAQGVFARHYELGRLAPKALGKFKVKIRDMTRRNRGRNIEQTVEDLAPYLINGAIANYLDDVKATTPDFRRDGEILMRLNAIWFSGTELISRRYSLKAFTVFQAKCCVTHSSGSKRGDGNSPQRDDVPSLEQEAPPLWRGSFKSSRWLA
jgi:hypothetical protein